MSDNQVEKKIPFFAIIYKNIIIILALTLIFGAIGYIYCAKRVKTSYTATKSVIIRLTVDADTAGSSQSSAASNNATLSKMYVSSIAEIIDTQVITERASLILSQKGFSGVVVGGAISCDYNDGSLIFNISYTDKTAQTAQAKLDAVIESASEQLINHVEAKGISLIPVQNGDGIISEVNNTQKYTIIATVAGLVIGIFLALLRFFMDNTVSERDELEEITGVPFLTFIEEVKYDKN